MKKLIIALATTALLSSCGIYGKYERPEGLPTEGLYPAELMQVADTAHLGTLSWREVFTDPHLQSLIEQGLADNLDLRTAYLRIEQASASLRSARLGYLPSLALTPQGTMTKLEGSSPTYAYSLMASASWQLDLFGSITNAKRRARMTLEASEAYRQAVETQVIASIARTYYSLVLLDEQLRVSLETERIWSENVRVMKALMQAGQYNDAAVSSSEANYAQVRASVLTLRQQIRETERALSMLLGRSDHDTTRSTLDGWQSPRITTVALPVSLLSQRPDLRRAEANLAAAFYATNSARSAFYPSLTLSGTGGWTNSLGGLIVSPAQLLLSAVGSITQPIFQNGRLTAQLRIARSQQQEAFLAFVQSLLSAGNEVNNYYAQTQTYRQQADLYAERTSALKRTVRATRLLMESGSSSYLEVLTAEQNLLSSQLSELSNRFNEISSTIALYQALGGGVDASLPRE